MKKEKKYHEGLLDGISIGCQIMINLIETTEKIKEVNKIKSMLAVAGETLANIMTDVINQIESKEKKGE